MIEESDSHLNDDQKLEQAFSDPRALRVIIRAFRQLTNRVITLENAVNGTSNEELSEQQIKNWFRGKLKQP